MGITNDAILCYGIEYSYNEIKHLKKLQNETKRVMKDIDLSTYKCEVDSDSDVWMPNLWDELGFISASNYYDSDEEYHTYIIGKEVKSDITLHDFLNEINETEMVVYLKNTCQKYNLKYKRPKILCRPNVY